MKIRFLGTGTSTGVPQIGCECKACTSADPRDKRLRASVWIEVGDRNIVIDCSPDFRQQVLSLPFKKIDGVLITHEHYDHVGGIDDLRPFARFGEVDLYLEPKIAGALRDRMSYCFGSNKYMGSPQIRLNEIHFPDAFQIAGVDIIPIRIMHHKLPILGYRIADFAYLTDLKHLPEEELPKLQGLGTLVLNALRKEEHVSHENLEQALALARKINPCITYFTHISHQMGLHREMSLELPDDMHFAYDGMVINA
ncbi:MAG: MBL fold metallo-hydrolase [Dysgonamonadaceae bacterium]|jgi:phosphoribosyl 1,2-cyclic phosphate phosphodiesterase|nr:MBL fold metallo-hydrolase [Dysgonamonadaceae bacterium]